MLKKNFIYDFSVLKETDLDILLVCLTEDKRSMTLLDYVSSNNIKVNKIFILIYDSQRQYFYENYKIKVENLAYDYEVTFAYENNWSSYSTEFIDMFKGKKIEKVFIDITAMIPQYYYLFIYIFKEVILSGEISILYTSPNYYSTQYTSSSFLSKSENFTISFMPGFSNDISTSKETLYIVILGFDGNLFRWFMDHTDTDNIVCLNGFPSYLPNYKDVSVINNRIYPENLRYSNALNPYYTYNSLQKIYDENHKKYSIQILPLGSKPMSIGAALFAIENKDVSIINILSDKYTFSSSVENAEGWLFKLN